MTARVAVIRFPGSNCHRESMAALRRNGMQAHSFFWNEPTSELRHYDAFMIVGGFAYEDRSRAGVIAAQSSFMHELLAAAGTQKPVLGICNGAQILLEAQALLPQKSQLALEKNQRTRDGQVVGTGYYNDWCLLKRVCTPQRTPFTGWNGSAEVLSMPFAHAEGSFQCAPATLARLRHNKQLVFCYANAQAEIDERYPSNPNGSVAAAAGICNPAGNVLALMPHPERTTQADGIFESMALYLRKPWSLTGPFTGSLATPEAEQRAAPAALPSDKTPTSQAFNPFPTADLPQYTLRVGLKITDHHGFSVTQILQKRGYDIRVQRQTLWTVDLDFDARPKQTLEKLRSCGEIINHNKERVCEDQADAQHCIVTMPKRNIEGQSTLQRLHRRYGIHGIKQLYKGNAWLIDAPNKLTSDALSALMNTHLFHHPQTHDCYILY